MAAVVAYAVSPIDLVPDFIPLIGYLDDLLLVPLGLAVAIRLIPEQVLVECRAEARQALRSRPPTSWLAGAMVAAVWLVTGGLAAWWLYELVA